MSKSVNSNGKNSPGMVKSNRSLTPSKVKSSTDYQKLLSSDRDSTDSEKMLEKIEVLKRIMEDTITEHEPQVQL